MFYSSDDIDEHLKCSVCKQMLLNVAKLVPDCGEAICECCYEELKDSVDKLGLYKCSACSLQHTMQVAGFPDIKCLNRLSKMRRVERPLTEETKKLKSIIASFEDQVRELRSFDERDYINHHCDQLDLQITEEIDSIVKRLNEIGKELHEEINEFRESCLDACSYRLASQAAKDTGIHANEARREMDALINETAKFRSRWNDYFNHVDSAATDAEAGKALTEARQLEQRLNSLQRRLKMIALDDNAVTSTANEWLFGEDSSLISFMQGYIVKSQEKIERIHETPLHTLTGHTGLINQVLFLPDGQLASCSSDKTIRVWDVKHGATLYKLESRARSVKSMALLQNGWLASGTSDATIEIWNLEKKRLMQILKGHAKSVVSLLLLKNGNLASFSEDQNIKIWNPSLMYENNLLLSIDDGLENAKFMALFSTFEDENLVTWHPMTQNEPKNLLKIWSPSDGRLVKSLTVNAEIENVQAFLALPNNRAVLGSESGTITIINMNNGFELSMATQFQDGAIIWLGQLSNGSLICCAREYSIHVWALNDTHNLVQNVVVEDSNYVNAACISPDEKLLATVSFDRTIKLWPIKQ